jgi:hypothetical protein
MVERMNMRGREGPPSARPGVAAHAAPSVAPPAQGGWYAYAPLSRSATWGSVAVSSSSDGAGEPLRPELSDIGRLARRAIRGVVAAARADEQPSVTKSLRAHLGTTADAPVVSGHWPPYEHVNVQIAIDEWLSRNGRTHDLVGLTGFQHRMFGLADLVSQHAGMAPGIGNVAMANLPAGPQGRTHSCVQCGVYLVTDAGTPLAIFVRGSDHRGPQEDVLVEVLSGDAEHGERIIAELRALALERNVYRGQVVSFGGEMFGPHGAALQFHQRPVLDRAALVLPDGALDEIERQVLGVAAHRDRLRDAGQHLKRGLLLHGPPGTGKTHTVRYLMSRLDGVTIVILSGGALRMIGLACSVARSLTPSLVVIEDVDLIGEDRGMNPGAHPLLFQLLNEMDGLGEDLDVAFLLTTNRVELLEHALAQRPGRVDQAVEIPLPQAAERRRLIELYRGGLELDDAGLDDVVERTSGVTASFLKELLRRAALLAAEADPDASGPLRIDRGQLERALDVLLDSRNRLTRALLGSAD